ncbi:MAG: resolvase [Polaromonas sp.]|nr:resolvase [Polaromonas sp.]
MTQKPTIAAPVITDPDLVDRIFEYLLSEFPQISGPRLEDSKRAVRAEFKGLETYIPGRSQTERYQLAVQVLTLFNGRNASEVARRLQISRATVYRFVKQAGHDKSSLKFPVIETASAVRSKPSDATLAAAPNQD